MSDASPRVLICLIAGKSSLFKVKLAGNKNIIDLRKLIKEECMLSEVASMDLILWKVRMHQDTYVYLLAPCTRLYNLVQGQKCQKFTR